MNPVEFYVMGVLDENHTAMRRLPCVLIHVSIECDNNKFGDIRSYGDKIDTEIAAFDYFDEKNTENLTLGKKAKKKALDALKKEETYKYAITEIIDGRYDYKVYDKDTSFLDLSKYFNKFITDINLKYRPNIVADIETEVEGSEE